MTRRATPRAPASGPATSAESTQLTIHFPQLHHWQELFVYSPAKRKVIRAGRRSGKTVGIAVLAGLEFLKGRRVLYCAPTNDQVSRFWYEVKLAFAEPIQHDLFYLNETQHILERPGTLNRIRAKTAWNADSLRGDYADLLIFDEYQLMSEDAWGVVGLPMLMDNRGDAVFIYTPPSLHSRSRSKADDPRHAAKLFKAAGEDPTGIWQTFHFSSLDNPYLAAGAAAEMARDMTHLAYEQEILALDKDEAPGAFWTHEMIEALRVSRAPELTRVVVGVDPPGGVAECGIVTCGKASNGHYYVLTDNSLGGKPGDWGPAVVRAYHENAANFILAEKNFGGEMVEHTLRTLRGGTQLPIQVITAHRGKALRAEPVAALYQQGLVHHVGAFPYLEDQMAQWEPDGGGKSPDRLDALVHGLAYLLSSNRSQVRRVASRGLYASEKLRYNEARSQRRVYAPRGRRGQEAPQE